MTKIDLQRVVREQLNTLRVNLRPGTAAYESETLKAAALWDMFEAPLLPGVVEARREQSNYDVAALNGDIEHVLYFDHNDDDDDDTEVDVA